MIFKYMKLLLSLIPILIFSIFQGAFLRFNLVLLTLLITCGIYISDRGINDKSVGLCLLLALISGIILDLAMGVTVGRSSMFFIGIVFLMTLYLKKFDFFNPVILPIVSVVGNLIYGLIFFQAFWWKESLLLGLLAALFRLVFMVATGYRMIDRVKKR